jgi:hypothetical protein
MVAIKNREAEALRAAVKRVRAAKAVSITPAAMKLEEARHYLSGLSARSVLHLCSAGRLKPNRVLRHLIFTREELEQISTRYAPTQRRKQKEGGLSADATLTI